LGMFSHKVAYHYILAMLSLQGELSRAEIKAAFNVSTAQATIYLRSVTTSRPDLIVYDVSRRKYVRGHKWVSYSDELAHKVLAAIKQLGEIC